MTQVRFNLDEYSVRVLDMIKAKFGFKNRNQAFKRFVEEYGEEIVPKKLNEKYLFELDKKVKSFEKEKGFKKSMSKKEFNSLFD